MGQAIEEPKGTLTLYVKALGPAIPKPSANTYTATNHAWREERLVLAEITCTQMEALKIAEIHRKLNGDDRAAAEWKGSVTL